MNKKLGRLLWPGLWAFFAVMVAFVVAAAVTENYLLALGEGALTAFTGVYYVIYRVRHRREIQQYVKTAFNAAGVPGGAEVPLAMVLVRLGDEAILWTNDSFNTITGYQDKYLHQRLETALPGLSLNWLTSGKTEYPYDITIGNRRYRVYGTILRGDDPDATPMAMLYMSDMTEMYLVRDEYIRSRPVVSVILVDNYEELTKNMTESAISSLNARVNEIITQWADEYHGLLRRTERNRFLLVMEKHNLERAKEGKFPVLEEIHQVENPTGLQASISIGIGVDGDTFEESYDFAALALEMALSRGGDQAVIKDRFNFTFIGGRSKESDHRSKVRSRLTANSLVELMTQSDQVYIMGHKNADLDSVGAAIGIACICRKKGKKANIVLDLEHNVAERLIEEIQAVPEYRGIFISGQEALEHCTTKSVLVVVDTNHPGQVECQPLLEAIPQVCVVDHHRRAAAYINPVVYLHETYASSASELVTELLQYVVERSDIMPIEAKSLMAGIFLDTKSFNVRTGERTFEAAAVLRQWGADTVEVKKLLQNDFQDTMNKYQIIKSARLYRQEIAIAALTTTTSRALAAQSADELLNISGISTSFVLYPDGDQVMISARSIGDANVQVILERLGGGGNTATAGAQMKGCTVKEALDQLVASIDKFYEV